MFQFIEDQAKSGSMMTAQDILAVWTEKKKPTGEVTVVSESPSISTVTGASDATSTSSSTKSVFPTNAAPVAASPESVSPTNTPTTVHPGSDQPSKTKKKKRTQKRKNGAPSVPSPVPTTPATKKRPVENLAPNQRSPERMTNGLFAYGCHHKNITGLIPYERSHFNKELCKQDNYPDSCSGCAKSLLPGSDKTKHCIIKDVFQMRCCHNAINHLDHPCVFALCHHCWSAKVEESATQRAAKKPRRSAKRSRLVLPGEKALPDGTVTAL